MALSSNGWGSPPPEVYADDGSPVNGMAFAENPFSFEANAYVFVSEYCVFDPLLRQQNHRMSPASKAPAARHPIAIPAVAPVESPPLVVLG
jgi:hypothetical protein